MLQIDLSLHLKSKASWNLASEAYYILYMRLGLC